LLKVFVSQKLTKLLHLAFLMFQNFKELA